MEKGFDKEGLQLVGKKGWLYIVFARLYQYIINVYLIQNARPYLSLTS